MYCSFNTTELAILSRSTELAVYIMHATILTGRSSMQSNNFQCHVKLNYKFVVSYSYTMHAGYYDYYSFS